MFAAIILLRFDAFAVALDGSFGTSGLKLFDHDVLLYVVTSL